MLYAAKKMHDVSLVPFDSFGVKNHYSTLQRSKILHQGFFFLNYYMLSYMSERMNKVKKEKRNRKVIVDCIKAIPASAASLPNMQHFVMIL